jgi:hypothetical protein
MGRKFISQKKQTKEEMFDAVVKNAIDFIDSSLDDLDKRPKNGIVDFYTSIELFLKARLMSEHWSLIIYKLDTVNLQSFSMGDFISVNLDDAAKRLKDILGDPLPEKALDNFKALAEHRNQIVHFTHTDYADVAAIKAGVVVEQWASWYYMYELLTVNWKVTFKAYLSEIERLNKRIMLQKDFIRARYNELEPSIKNKIKSGLSIIRCNHCHMPAALVTENHKWGADYKCLVCNAEGTAVKPTKATVTCDKCGQEFEFFQNKINGCSHCGQSIDTDKLISLCEKKYTKGDEWCEEGGPHIAYCHSCQHPRPSVFFIDGLWSCVSCFDRGWQAISCPHCNEFVTGDMDTIKHYACFKCEE